MKRMSETTLKFNNFRINNLIILGLKMMCWINTIKFGERLKIKH